MSTFGRKILETPIKDFQLGDELDAYRRNGKLTKADVEHMLQVGPVRFVVADVGYALELVEANQCFEFWKTEGRQHLADRPSRLEDFPDEYLYFASRWVAEGANPIILLEKHH